MLKKKNVCTDTVPTCLEVCHVHQEENILYFMLIIILRKFVEIFQRPVCGIILYSIYNRHVKFIHRYICTYIFMQLAKTAKFNNIVGYSL